MKKALVTGGAGFIGSHLTDLLLEKGFEVKVFDNLSFGRKDNLQTEAELVEGDITDYGLVLKESKGYDFIFHLAALASVPESVDKPLLYDRVNVGGTLNVLEAARKNNAERFVFASSSAVYGLNEPPHDETMNPMPLSAYALNKLIGEQYAALYSELFGLDTVSLRLFNVFGPRQALKGQYSNLFPKFSEAFVFDKEVQLFGEGKPTRDYVFVKDVAKAFFLAATAPGEFGGEVFNIGSGKATSVLEVFNVFKKEFGIEKEAVMKPARKGDPDHTLALVEKAKEGLGFFPKHSLEQGAVETIVWYRKNEERLK